MVTREIIDKIKSSLDIVDVISDYIDLKKVGKNYRALCPFHVEKTPSFYVSPEKQMYHCFGCGASGDVIKFVQEYEKISFMDALKKLADRAGIELNLDRRKSMYELYQSILGKLANVYHENLLRNPDILNHLKDERCISLNVIRKFKVGFCPKGSRYSLSVLKKNGLSERDGENFGILKRSRHGIVDFFEGRITFPISNESGKVIGFGGRIFPDDPEEPKYLNTVENAYFKKGRLLYGLDKARDAIKTTGFVVLVEGYMDLLALHSCGVENAVATLGSVASRYQIKVLSRLCRNFLLFFDGDEAGRKAGLNFLVNMNVIDEDISVMVLNPMDVGVKDPADLLRKLGCSGLREFLKKAVNYEDFLVSELSKDLNLSNVNGVEEFLRRLKRFSINMFSKNPVRFERLVRKVSDMIDLGETSVKMYLISSSPIGEEGKKFTTVEGWTFDAEDTLVKLFLNVADRRDEIVRILKEYRDFLEGVGRKLLDYLETLEDTGGFSEDGFISFLDKDFSNRFFRILTWDFEPADPESVILDCEKNLRNLRIRKRIEEIDELLKSVEDSKKRELMKLRMELLSTLKGGDFS